jgi:hypothetical protein
MTGILLILSLLALMYFVVYLTVKCVAAGVIKTASILFSPSQEEDNRQDC